MLYFQMLLMGHKDLWACPQGFVQGRGRPTPTHGLADRHPTLGLYSAALGNLCGLWLLRVPESSDANRWQALQEHVS